MALLRERADKDTRSRITYTGIRGVSARSQAHKWLLSIASFTASSFLTFVANKKLALYSARQTLNRNFVRTNATHSSEKAAMAFQVSKSIGITRERSIILQIHELKSKKTLLETYIETLTYSLLIFKQL